MKEIYSANSKTKITFPAVSSKPQHGEDARRAGATVNRISYHDHGHVDDVG